ncbi:MAG: hypothetical protein DRN15_07670 [Thermoprotei archaeon]|nr:MAG: hypothetical protein DRN15_07670 [Thermoprotei archaeon]
MLKKWYKQTIFLISACITLVIILLLAVSMPILTIAAITPHLAYLIYVWIKEEVEREPLAALFMVFSYGFIVSSTLAIIIEGVLVDALNLADVYALLLLAPIVEELTKFSGVYLVAKNRRLFNEIDDGIVYGASAGLGFSAIETILYAMACEDPLFVSLIRAISSTASHAAATALSGLGLALYMFRGSISSLPLLFMCAILLHMVHNFMVMMGPFTLLILIVIDLSVFLLTVMRVE